MFDSLWTNLHAATMADGYGIIKNASIGVTDGKIAWIGATDALPKPPETMSDYVHDAKGRWATPGLIDCHTHLAYAGTRADEFEQRLKGASYAEIAQAGGGILSTVRATRAATEDELYDATLARLRVLFQQGVTTFEIKSGYGLDLASERKMLRVATRLRDELGLRIQRTLLAAHAVPPETGSDAYIDHICAEILPTLHAEGLVDAVDGFCETIAFSPAQIDKVFSAARALGLPVKLHAEQLSNQNGAALAAKHGALSADHIEYLDESGVVAMAKAGTAAVLLPGAFYTLREKQLPPIDLLRRYKVPMAVATDHNPGTSPALSLILMANMACTLFGLTPEEALAGITKNAARALGLQGVCGTLETGKAADFVFWDIEHPRDLCYTFGSSPCTTLVMAGGIYQVRP